MKRLFSQLIALNLWRTTINPKTFLKGIGNNSVHQNYYHLKETIFLTVQRKKEVINRKGGKLRQTLYRNNNIKCKKYILLLRRE